MALFLRINNRSSFYFSEHGRGEGLRAFAETGREYNSIPSKTRYRRVLPTGSTYLKWLIEPALNLYLYYVPYVSIHIDPFYFPSFYSFQYLSSFLSFHKLRKWSNPSPKGARVPLVPLVPVGKSSRATYLPTRAKHYRTCALLPAEGGILPESFVIRRALKPRANICEFSLSFPSLARSSGGGRGSRRSIFLPTPLSVSLNTPSLLQIPLPSPLSLYQADRRRENALVSVLGSVSMHPLPSHPIPANFPYETYEFMIQLSSCVQPAVPLRVNYALAEVVERAGYR